MTEAKSKGLRVKEGCTKIWCSLWFYFFVAMIRECGKVRVMARKIIGKKAIEASENQMPSTVKDFGSVEAVGDERTGDNCRNGSWL